MTPRLRQACAACTAALLVTLATAVGPHQPSEAAPSPCEVRGLTPLYDLTLDGVSYHVVNVPGASSPRGRRAFLRGEVLVQDLTLARILATAAWVRESIVHGTGPMPYRSPREALVRTRQTFVQIRRYVLVQDLVVSAWVAAPLITVLGPQSAPRIVGNITRDMLIERVRPLDFFLTHVAYRGVSDAITHYERVDSRIAQVRSQVLDVSVAQELYEDYLRAVQYERQSRGLMTALMPQTNLDLLLRAVRRVGQAAVSQFPRGPVPVDLQEIARARAAVDNALRVDRGLSRIRPFTQYFEDVQFAQRLVASIGEWIDEWATGAVRFCEVLTALSLPSAPTSPPRPSPAASPAPTPAVAQPISPPAATLVPASPVASPALRRPVWRLGDSWVMEHCAGSSANVRPFRFTYRIVGEGAGLGYQDVYLLERSADTGEVSGRVLDRNLNPVATFDPRTQRITQRLHNRTQYSWPLTDGKGWTFEGESRLSQSTLPFRGEARVAVFEFQGQVYFRLMSQEVWQFGTRWITFHETQIWDASGRQVLWSQASSEGLVGSPTWDAPEMANPYCLRDHPISAWARPQLVASPTSQRIVSFVPGSLRPPVGFTGLLGASRTNVLRWLREPTSTSVEGRCLRWMWGLGTDLGTSFSDFGSNWSAMLQLDFCDGSNNVVTALLYRCGGRQPFATHCPTSLRTIAASEGLGDPVQWRQVVVLFEHSAHVWSLAAQGLCERIEDAHILYRPGAGILMHIDVLNRTQLTGARTPTWKPRLDERTGLQVPNTCVLNRLDWHDDNVVFWEVTRQ